MTEKNESFCFDFTLEGVLERVEEEGRLWITESLRASGIDAVVTVVSVTARSSDSRLSRATGKSCTKSLA